MNPIYQEMLGSLLRHVLTWAAGYLVARDIWTEAAAERYVGALALAILGTGWGVWQKAHARRKLRAALEAPAGTAEADLPR